MKHIVFRDMDTVTWRLNALYLQMKLFLQAHGLEVWKIVKTGFTFLEGVDEPIDPT